MAASKKLFTDSTKTALKPILLIRERRNCQLELTFLTPIISHQPATKVTEDCLR